MFRLTTFEEVMMMISRMTYGFNVLDVTETESVDIERLTSHLVDRNVIRRPV